MGRGLCIAGGAVLLLVSIALIIAGVLVQDVVDSAIKSGVKDAITLTPKDQEENATSWYNFNTNVETFYTTYHFHYKNYAAMLANGSKPEVEARGPLVYSEIATNYNISFSPDLTLLHYNQWWYKTQLNLSDPAWNVSATCINTIYWALPTKVFVLLKQSLSNAATGLTTTTHPAPSTQFPVGYGGGLVFPANPATNLPSRPVTVSKSESIVGKFVAPIVLPNLKSLLASFPDGSPAPFPQFVKYVYLAGYMRELVQQLLTQPATFATYAGNATRAIEAMAGQWIGLQSITGSASPVSSLPGFGNFTGFELCTTPATCPFNTTVMLAAATRAFSLSSPGNLLVPSGTSGSQLWASAVSNSSAVAALRPTARGTLAVLYPGLFDATVTNSPLEAWATGLGGQINGASRSYETFSISGFKRLLVDGATPAFGGNATLAGAFISSRWAGGALVGGRDPNTFVEIGYLQFATLQGVGGTGSADTTVPAGLVAGLARGADVYFGPEFHAYQAGRAGNANLTPALKWDQARNWFEPNALASSLPFSSATMFGLILSEQLLNTKNASERASTGVPFGALIFNKTGGLLTPANLATVYGITESNFPAVMDYLTVYAPFHLLIYRYLIAQNFGPWNTVTAHQLFRGYSAPAELVALLAVALPSLNPNNPGILTSYANQEAHYAETYQGLYTIYTGSDWTINIPRHFQAYRGASTFTTLSEASLRNFTAAGESSALWEGCFYSDSQANCKFWESAESADYSSTARQFPPFHEDDPLPAYPIWVAEGMRAVEFITHDDVEIKGIKAKRYIANPLVLKPAAEHPPNAKYYQINTPAGIIDGTTFNKGLPQWLSRPHFLEADPRKVINKLIGLNPIFEEHYSFVDIETYSGAAINGAKRFQTNVYADRSVLDWPYHANILNYLYDDNDTTIEGRYVYFPVGYGTESKQLTDKDASDFKEGVYDNRDLAEKLAIIFLVVGVVLAAASIICLVFQIRKTPQSAEAIRMESRSTL